MVVDDEEQAVLSVAQAGALDRRLIRQRATGRFGHQRMVDAYVAVYQEILGVG